MRCGRGGVGFHTMFLLALVSVFLHLAVLFMCVRVCVVRPFGALLRILNILARHTIVSPWFVGIAYSESTLCWWEGVGFHTSFLFDLGSVFFHFAGLRTFGCVRVWCAPLAPSFVFLTYLFAFSLFPLCPWPPHTFCAFVDFFFFRWVSPGGRSLWRNKYGGYMVVVCVCVHAF